MALWRAVWITQARGNSGMPAVRHWSTAAANASCAASSATSKSPTIRIRVATIRPQSDRYSASTALAVSWAIADGRYFGPELSIRTLAVRFTDGGTHMKYLLLICDEEQAWAKLSEGERREMYAEYG